MTGVGSSIDPAVRAVMISEDDRAPVGSSMEMIGLKVTLDWTRLILLNLRSTTSVAGRSLLALTIGDRCLLAVPNGEGGLPAPSSVRTIPAPSTIDEQCKTSGGGGVPAPLGVRMMSAPSIIGEPCVIHGGGGVPAPSGVRGIPAPSSCGIS